MSFIASLKKPSVRNAIMIGTLCSSSYLGVYFARNILSAVTPQIIEAEGFTEEYIGMVSSLYFMFYAFGQLINGMIGDRIKARYMISFGLILAGVTQIIFPHMLDTPQAAQFVYGMTGFFLSMIYAPMTKVVSENTEPIYATRCSLGYTFASFFGSPLAGIAAAALVWTSVFNLSSIILFIMGTLTFTIFLTMEKKGIVKYGQYKPNKTDLKSGIGTLIRCRIIKFTFVSILTGVVRTTVVFWLPTYISQYLQFDAKTSAMLFTVATFIISMSAFVAVFVYEKLLKRNMDIALFLFFISAAVSFLCVYFIRIPALNILFMVLSIMSSNCAASMLWSRYCPSLRDTGMVSSATGFLDFVSYMSAAASSTIFANAVTSIGWKNLILVWCGLMVCGIIVAIPRKSKYAMPDPK